MALHITVLGDSSSSGIGPGRDCYPYRLFELLREGGDVHVANCAVPGATSADVSRYFRAEGDARPLDCLVVYLGNNEGAAGPHKGTYSPWREWLADLGRARDRPFQPILSPPRFRFSRELPATGVAASPAEFAANLAAIVRRATQRGARVVLVNPVANRLFPCGGGTPNITYFAFLDEIEALGNPPPNDPVDEESRRLAKGLRDLADGRVADAIGSWEPLASRRGVAGYIARQNLACARARAGDAGAEAALRALLGEIAAYDSVILYNLAGLKRLRGDDAEASRLQGEAYEADASLYRIRQAYREAVAGFSRAKGVHVLDLGAVLGAEHFVDYCHPTEEGHRALARALAPLVGSGAPARGTPGGSRYERVLPSPDYLRRPGETLVDYYCIDWPLGRDRIAAALANARAAIAQPGGDSGDDLDRCLANFLRANGHHPAFTPALDLDGAWAPQSHEVLSVPEQFLHRLLRVYSAAFEQAGLGSRLECGERLGAVRLGSRDYDAIVLRSGSAGPEGQVDASPEYLEAVMARVRAQLTSEERLFSVTLGERLRTVMTWFTREAFRYGTHSRMSMLYARPELDRIVEGLVVAAVVADRRRDERALRAVDGLLGHVLSVLCIHEDHVGRFHNDKASFCAGAYAADLSRARKRVHAALPDPNGDHLR